MTTAEPTVLVVDHPLASARLAVLREETTPPPTFRAALSELSRMLVYEACRTLPTKVVSLRTPVAPASARVPAEEPLLVPVLRAGLGMLDAAIGLLPQAQVGFVGIARDEQTRQPVPYLASLPDDLAGRRVLVLDPMLATGGSLLHCLSLLRQRGAGQLTVVCVLAAPEGLAALLAAGAGVAPDAVVLGALDERLDERAYIVPGLGDAGDRQFGGA